MSNSPWLSVTSSLPRLQFSSHRGEFAATAFGRDKVLPRASGPIVSSGTVQGIEIELNNYDNLKRQLEGIYDQRGWVAMFQSKCQWIEQGESPTKYFFKLQSKNYSKKVISKLETENGTPITGKDQISAEIEHYYQNLWIYGNL